MRVTRLYWLTICYNSEAVVADRIGEITGTKPQLEVFDLCKRKKLNKFFSENNDIAAIIHFAAYKAVGESVNKPLEYYRNNLLSLMNLLDAMKEFSIPSIVFSSSCTVYGQPEKLPVTEDAPHAAGNFTLWQYKTDRRRDNQGYYFCK